MDLGASSWRSVRMVLIPLLLPAIFASFAIVFADSIDDFIVVRYLSADASTETIPIQIYSNARGSATPSLNALATIMLFSTLAAVTIGYLIYRSLTRGERRGGGGLQDFAAQI
jgi:spermidine/putrescine transport system permease protein